MLSMIRDYFLLLFAKAIFAVLFFALFMLVVFLGYCFFCNYGRAIHEVTDILTCDTLKFFLGLASIGLFFHTAEYKSSPKKFDTNKYLDRVFFEHDNGARMF